MKTPSIFVSPLSLALLAAALAMAAPPVLAHGDAHTTKAGTDISAEQHAFGRAGNPKEVTRTIVVDMDDSMRFQPSEIRVKQGETIRFIVKNQGQVLHEMVLGTLEQLKAHGALMRQNPEMEHDEPYMAHVKPGGQEQMVWQFNKAGEFNYGCLAPGHFEAGMIGKIIVTKG